MRIFYATLIGINLACSLTNAFVAYTLPRYRHNGYLMAFVHLVPAFYCCKCFYYGD